MTVSISKIRLGSKVQYKAGIRKGKATTGFVLRKLPEGRLRILRPYQNKIVEVPNEDIVGLDEEE